MPRRAPQPRPVRRALPPALLRTVISALPLPAVITDGSWREGGADIRFANGAFCELTGYTADELRAHNTRVLHGPRTDLVLLQRGLRGAPLQSEGWLHRKDGTAFHARWSFSPLPGGRRLGACAAVAVSDTGQGMTAEVRQRVFEPFFTTKPHGTGLGLPMALGFVRRHGGHMNARSEPGQGATFELHLPETPEPARTFSTALPFLPVERGHERVLLFEPDEVLRKMVGGILTTDGYQVVVVDTPAAVREALAGPETRPDLLIVDCGAKTAALLARSLREAGPGPKVLCISHSASATLEGLAPDRIAHLPKPFALSALLRAARTLLDGRLG